MNHQRNHQKKRLRPGRLSGGPSVIWRHFKRESNVTSCLYCDFQTKDKRSSNLKVHLKKHPTALSDVKSKTESKRSVKVHAATPATPKQQMPSDQSSLMEWFSRPTPYLLHTLDPKFSPPNRKQLARFISLIYQQLKTIIGDSIEGSRKICLVLDIWSRKGLSESYLGILAQYFDQKTKRVRKALLGLEKMSGRHTAENIRKVLDDVVFGKWGIENYKISFYVTDSGSNIVKALKNCVIDVQMIDEIDDDDENGDNQLEGDPNMEASAASISIDDEINEFEESENSQNEVFGISQRVSCIAHKMACVSRKKIDDSNDLKPIISSALSIVRAFGRSTRKSELLIERCGKKLVHPAQTRWLYLDYVLDRLVELKPDVDEIIVEENDTEIALSPMQWKYIKELRDLLEPFANYVTQLEGDLYTTVSRVLPSIIDLIEECREASESTQNSRVIKHTYSSLKLALEEKFDFVLDSTCASFHPIYLASTFLDPNFLIGLDTDMQKIARNHIIQMIEKERNTERGTVPPVQTQGSSEMGKKSGFKRFFNPGASNNQSQSATQPRQLLDIKLQQYSDEVSASSSHSDQKEISAVEFWVAKLETSLKEIAEFALDILAVPATSAGIERAFSLAAIVQGGRRYRISAEMTESELFVKLNREFLQ